MLKLAESCGFCFGVRNALKIVERLLKEGREVLTLGHIIHNPEVIMKLKKKKFWLLKN